MTQELIILRGLPGSGKSTWARQYLIEHSDAVRVNRDALRDMLHGERAWSAADEVVTARARDALIVQALLLGRTVVVDDTNLRTHHVNALVALAPLGVAVRVVSLLNVPLEECIRRDARRAHPVGETRIREMAASVISEEPPNE